MKKIGILLVIIAGTLFFSNVSRAVEHPGSAPESEHKEHPGKTHTEEHPGGHEHPGEKEALSALAIIEGIKGHINSITDENNGIFPIHDDQEGKNLKLKLVKVHEDKVSHIKKDDAYFACTDFVTEDGKTKYDVDFWMKKGEDNKLEVYQTKIHKKDGVERFTYKDDELVTVH